MEMTQEEVEKSVMESVQTELANDDKWALYLSPPPLMHAGWARNG